MNKGYTQANTKKTELAKKMLMGLTMNGKNSGYGGGMRAPGIGMNSGRGGGMPQTMAGSGRMSRNGGMNYSQSNKDASFSHNYTQNAKKKE